MRMYRRSAAYRQLALLLSLVVLSTALSGCFTASDNDRDGVLDIDDPDDDNDGMPDDFENAWALNPWDAQDKAVDSDHDNLSNLAEYRNATNPRAADSDSDGMQDGFEVANGLDPMDGRDAGGDADGDGLSNLLEFQLHTSPLRTDSDGDGMTDTWEWGFGLNADDANDAEADPDADRLKNLLEFEDATDPRDPDTDDDSMPDGWEVDHGFDPADGVDGTVDSDGDSFDRNHNGAMDPSEVYTNALEFALHTDPTKDDTDGDGIGDGYEWAFGLNGSDPTDRWADPDADGVSNLNESLAGSSAASADTDGDTMPDGFEIRYGLDPVNASDTGGDPDADGLSNALEAARGGDPLVNDTDGDGVLDGADADPAHDLVLRVVIRFVNITFPPRPLEANFDPPWELSFTVTIAGGLLPAASVSVNGSTNETGQVGAIALEFFLNVDDGMWNLSIVIALAEHDLLETVGVNADDVVDLDPTGNNDTLAITFDLVAHAISGEVTSGLADGSLDGRNGEADARILFDVLVDFA